MAKKITLSEPDPDIGHFLVLEGLAYGERPDADTVQARVRLRARSTPEELTYFLLEDRFQMNQAMDWFLSEGGRSNRLRKVIHASIELSRTLRQDGSKKRMRASPKARAAHLRGV